MKKGNIWFPCINYGIWAATAYTIAVAMAIKCTTPGRRPAIGTTTSHKQELALTMQVQLQLH